MRALDGFGRLVIAVMSALATLSLIASLASVSNPPLPLTGLPREPVAGRAGPAAPGGAPSGPVDAGESRGARVVESAASAPPATTGEIAHWLEALTYAVLALAGFAAVSVVLLLRIGGHLARISDR